MYIPADVNSDDCAALFGASVLVGLRWMGAVTLQQPPGRIVEIHALAAVLPVGDVVNQGTPQVSIGVLLAGDSGAAGIPTCYALHSTCAHAF
jgi:hypothetical protein